MKWVFSKNEVFSDLNFEFSEDMRSLAKRNFSYWISKSFFSLDSLW